MSANPTPNLDPFTAKAENKDVPLQEKIRDLHKIVRDAKIGMFTTRSEDGELHSRAMHSAAPTCDTQVTLFFIANNASYKFAEINHDSHVNVSFCDHSSTSWASYSGTARVSQDRDLIHKYWSHSIGAYFGDLGDGVHKGNEHDPRVAIIEVIPDEIRYWMATQGVVGRAINTTVSATFGRTSAPGEVRTITKEEITLTQALHSKQAQA